MKMYRTNSYDNFIEERTMSRVSAKTVSWINERGKEERSARESHYSTWHETKEAAVGFLAKKWEMSLKAAKGKVERYKSLLRELGKG